MPSDSQHTQARDRGGLEYVGTAAHNYFCDLEKLVKLFFQQNKIKKWIHHPARQLVNTFTHARVQEMFLEMEVFHREERSCSCDWKSLLSEMSLYYARLRINFICDWLSNNLNQKRGRSSDFAERKLALIAGLPLAAGYSTEIPLF